MVTEVDGPGGKILYKRKAPEESRVVAEHVDRDLTAMNVRRNDGRNRTRRRHMDP